MHNQQPIIGQLLHSLSVGGAEVLASRLACALRDRYAFVFLCLDGVGELGECLQREGFRVRVVERSEGIDWGCARRLAEAAREEKLDVIHAHQYTPFFYALASRWRGASLPVLFTEHGRFFPDLPSRKRMVYNRLMLQRRDRVVAVGRSVREALVRNEGIPEGRIEVIYNGIDLAPYDEPPDAEARRQLRTAIGLPADALVLIQVARLDYLKDHGTAIGAMERVARVRPDVHLALVGEGPERPKIEAAIVSRGLEGRVHLLGTRRDVPRLLHASDICLLTSISEGIPLTLIEGMAAGLPVIATDVGGVSEVVQVGTTGVLVPAREDAQLAEAIVRMAADPAGRAQMGQRGRDRARREFGELQMHQRYEQIWDAMLGDGVGRQMQGAAR